MRQGGGPSGGTRIDWDGAPNALARHVARLRLSGAELLDLTVSNPTLCFAPKYDAEIAAAFGKIRDFAYQPRAEGLLVARQAIADDYAEEGVSVNPEDLLLTASSSESYAFLFQALCDPGDEALTPLPSYPLFEYLAGLAGVRLRHYRLRYQGEWHVDFASLESAISERTRALVVVNPNNPTGSYIREFERNRLLEICAERGLTLIADEVFSAYPLRQPDVAAGFAGDQESALCISLGGLSKSAGMPQMKVGWMRLSGPRDARSWIRNRLELIADTYLSVSTPVQLALPKLLAIGSTIRGDIRSRIRENLDALEQSAARFRHISLPRVEGGWSAALRLPATRSDADWCEALLSDRHLLVQPGYFYDFDGDAWVVLSLLPTPGEFMQGMKQLGEFVEANS